MAIKATLARPAKAAAAERGPGDRDAMDCGSPLCRIIIEHAHQDKPKVPLFLQSFGYQSAGSAGTQYNYGDAPEIAPDQRYAEWGFERRRQHQGETHRQDQHTA
jgi:hypothetical protein